MKRMAGALALALCALNGWAQNYTVKGTVKGLADGTVVQLVPMSHDNEKPVATATVKGGVFTLSGTTEEPRCMLLKVKDAYGSSMLMVEKGVSMSLTGEAGISATPNGSSYYSFDVNYSGSPATARLEQLMSTRDSLGRVRTAFERKYKSLMEQLGKAYKTKNKALIDSLNNSPEGKAMGAEDVAFFNTVKAKFNQVVLDNKDTFWGPLMMICQTSYLTPDQKVLYDQLSPAAKASYYGKLVKEEVDPSKKDGQKVPDFKVKDAAGREITLKELCKGKKYILIDFWASWCVPCRKEIPNVKKLYAQYASKGFEVVSISIDKKKADWEKAVKAEQLKWPNFLDTTGVADLYKVKFVPTMYLIKADGTIVGDQLRGQALADKLAELYK